ncbi:MAG TPA: hypothetical protein VFW76_11940 [Ktedonobacterales bacterium]|nr:hypothetical protein [Ktedonobacterales bacterium]
MDKVIAYLFTDPNNTASGTPETFHFYLPWMIFCGLGLLIPLYFAFEGRKRFFGHHTLHKYLMNKFMNQLWPLALVGWILIGARYAELSLFDWRIWRYGWLLWLGIIAVYWGLYFTRHYSHHLEHYQQERVKAQYIPPPNPKKRTARAGH